MLPTREIVRLRPRLRHKYTKKKKRTRFRGRLQVPPVASPRKPNLAEVHCLLRLTQPPASGTKISAPGELGGNAGESGGDSGAASARESPGEHLQPLPLLSPDCSSISLPSDTEAMHCFRTVVSSAVDTKDPEYSVPSLVWSLAQSQPMVFHMACALGRHQLYYQSTYRDSGGE